MVTINPTAISVKLDITSNIQFAIDSIDPNGEMKFSGSRTNTLIEATGQIPPSTGNPGTPWAKITNNGDPISISAKLNDVLPTGVKLFLGPDYANTGYLYLTTTPIIIWANMATGEVRDIWAKAKFDGTAPIGTQTVSITVAHA